MQLPAMKTIPKSILLTTVILGVAYSATVIFAADIIAKTETRNIAREDADYFQAYLKNKKEGRTQLPLPPYINEQGVIEPATVTVVASQYRFPLLIRSDAAIRRGATTYPAVEGDYLWLGFCAVRLSGNPWECKGMFVKSPK